MEFTDVIKNRYSCKKYSDRAVEGDKLEAILEAGRVAPTAKSLQEQHVYVLQSADALEKFDGLTPCRYSAPTVLLVAFDSENVYTYPGSKRTSGIEDASIVATHMILAAANEGVDSCWINRFSPEEAAKAFGLPANEVVLCAIDLGYAAEGTGPLPNHASRKELAQTVTRL
jgi:nitroreductase